MAVDMSEKFFDMADVNYLGIDYGSRRIGISIYHGEVKLALPMKAIITEYDDEKVEKICAMVKENNIDEIAIGYPINMDGTQSDKAKQVDRFIETLSDRLPGGIKINLVDERLTSEQAIDEQKPFYMKQSASKTRKRRSRGIIDSQAATIILEDFLWELELKNNRQ
ncbi:MAG: Holliday junction resolvase RuvX [Puniceicoccales bacterium]|jgi:putative Holliday junction resolvase|nr:Holliday junction resolvase RuvX [Puniceicoccales bacterium]